MRRGAGAEHPFGGNDLGAGDKERGAALRLPDPDGEVGVQCDGAGGVIEHAFAAGVEEAFRRQVLGQDDVVAFQFDVVVGDGVHRHLRDGIAVDQAAHRDQHVFHIQGVVGGEEQVTLGQAGAEGAGTHPHRPDFAGGGVARAIDRPMPDPNDAGGAREQGGEGVADAEVFDGDVAVVRANARTRGEAGQGAEAALGVDGFKCIELGRREKRRQIERAYNRAGL